MKDELWENTRLIDKTFPINVFHNKRKGPQVLRLHWHEHFEIIMVKRGTPTYQIGNNRIETVPGDVLFVNSGELHAGYSETNKLVEYYAIVFHPSLLGHVDPFAIDSVVPFTSGERMFSNLLDPSHELYPNLKGTVKSIISEFEKKHQGYELAVKGHCQLFFIWLTRSHVIDSSSGSGRQLEGWRKKAERFKEFITYVEQHYRDNITIPQAAEMVHLSPYHFCTTFKKLTSLTFIQFVNLQRIYEAEHLLKYTAVSVTEIAEMVGCSSVHSFNKLFRKYKQCSPTVYRRASIT